MCAAPCRRSRSAALAWRLQALTAVVALATSFAASGVTATGEARADPPPAPLVPLREPAGAAEQLARALAYEHGEGLPKDQRVAAALYCEAAVDGNAEAAFRLGWMYANGRGVEHDDGIAAALFELASAEGHAYASNGSAGRSRPPTACCPIACGRSIRRRPASCADEDEDTADPFGDLSPDKKKVADLVNEIAPRYGIQPRLALAVISRSSPISSHPRGRRRTRAG